MLFNQPFATFPGVFQAPSLSLSLSSTASGITKVQNERTIFNPESIRKDSPDFKFRPGWMNGYMCVEDEEKSWRRRARLSYGRRVSIIRNNRFNKTARSETRKKKIGREDRRRESSRIIGPFPSSVRIQFQSRRKVLRRPDRTSFLI